MNKRVVFVLLALASFCVPGTAVGQEFVSGSRPLGLGGAFTSVATGASGIYHNPAGIATARMYSVSGTYEFTPSSNILNASIVDSKTNPSISAGVGYSYLLGRETEPEINGHDIRMALAMPALPDRVSVGVGGRYLILEAGETELARGFTMDAGFLFQLVDKLHVGVTGKNLIDVCDQEHRCGGVTPLTVSGGISYGSSTSFLVTGDVGFDLTSDPDTVHQVFGLGAEYLIGGSVPLRIGYKHETLDASHLLSTGLGWRTSQFGIDLGGRMDLNNADDLSVSASFSVYLK